MHTVSFGGSPEKRGARPAPKGSESSVSPQKKYKPSQPPLDGAEQPPREAREALERPERREAQRPARLPNPNRATQARASAVWDYFEPSGQPIQARTADFEGASRPQPSNSGESVEDTPLSGLSESAWTESEGATGRTASYVLGSSGSYDSNPLFSTQTESRRQAEPEVTSRLAESTSHSSRERSPEGQFLLTETLSQPWPAFQEQLLPPNPTRPTQSR